MRPAGRKFDMPVLDYAEKIISDHITVKLEMLLKIKVIFDLKSMKF